MDLKARNNMTDEKKVPEWVGTVSHATMRWEDLIPAFTDFLREIGRLMTMYPKATTSALTLAMDLTTEYGL
mgnify:CR=1 FL=1